MNDVMHVVAKVWYRLHYWQILLFSAFVAGGCMFTRFGPGTEAFAHSYGLTVITLALSTSIIIYCSTFYWVIARRNPPMAMFIAAIGFVLLAIEGLILTNPGTGAWIYVVGFLLAAFFSGMFGSAMVLGSILLGGLYALFEAHIKGGLDPQTWTILGGSVVVAGISFMFWRNKFTDRVDNQIAQMSSTMQNDEGQSAILIQSIADGVIVTDTEGKIRLINQPAAVMTEWPIEEAAGIDVKLVATVAKETGATLPEQENPFSVVLTTKKRLSQNYQLTGRKGRKQLISLVVSPITVPGGEVGGTVSIMHDISESRAAEQQRAEFISTASHEMRTPVAAIEGYLALALNDKVSTVDTRARGYLERAHSSTQHLGQLFQDLLTSAKAEDGRLSSHPSVIEMGTYLEQLVTDLKFSAQKKGLSTEYIVGANEAIDATSESSGGGIKKVVKPLYYVYADPDRMREVITNLFDNAVKYTDQGRISMGLTGNNEVVQFYVRDTGPGIPAEDIAHLFQKFYRVDNSATRTTSGTGLGLFICRKIVELYHGRIWVESELGKGSTFFINLPRLDTTKAQALQSTPPAAAAQPTTTT